MVVLSPIEVMCSICRRPILVPLLAGPVTSDGAGSAYIDIRCDEDALANHRCPEEGRWRRLFPRRDEV